MTKPFETAAAEAKLRRDVLLTTLTALRGRMSPPQLAEDALSLLDPELSLLGRLKERVRQHRLLSLAILAGAGWLAGAPRRRNGDRRETRAPGPTHATRANLKEKKNDSGQDNGNQWTGPGTGRSTEHAPKARAETLVNPQHSRKAKPGVAVPPLYVEPE